MLRRLLPILAAVAAATPALADTPAREVEQLMREYVRLWNAHDAGAISDRLYRLPPTHPLATRAGLQAEFDRLKAEGYDCSTTAALDACLLTRDRAMAWMRFSRLRADGTPLPPKDRASLYTLRRFPEGWRITSLDGLSPTAQLTCRSAID